MQDKKSLKLLQLFSVDEAKSFDTKLISGAKERLLRLKRMIREGSMSTDPVIVDLVQKIQDLQRQEETNYSKVTKKFVSAKNATEEIEDGVKQFIKDIKKLSNAQKPEITKLVFNEIDDRGVYSTAIVNIKGPDLRCSYEFIHLVDRNLFLRNRERYVRNSPSKRGESNYKYPHENSFSYNLDKLKARLIEGGFRKPPKGKEKLAIDLAKITSSFDITIKDSEKFFTLGCSFNYPLDMRKQKFFMSKSSTKSFKKNIEDAVKTIKKDRCIIRTGNIGVTEIDWYDDGDTYEVPSIIIKDNKVTLDSFTTGSIPKDWDAVLEMSIEVPKTVKDISNLERGLDSLQYIIKRLKSAKGF